MNLLELFAKEALTDGGVMAVYGHQPNMTAKQVRPALMTPIHSDFFIGSVAQLVCQQWCSQKLTYTRAAAAMSV